MGKEQLLQPYLCDNKVEKVLAHHRRMVELTAVHRTMEYYENFKMDELDLHKMTQRYP